MIKSRRLRDPFIPYVRYNCSIVKPAGFSQIMYVTIISIIGEDVHRISEITNDKWLRTVNRPNSLPHRQPRRR